MNVEEVPVAFECQGEALIGIVHVPEAPVKRGILAIVAGGPQYRAGCCRQLVQMARALAKEGTAVMRFDYRGIGDGAGPFQGFEHVEPDIQTALEVFFRHIPTLQEVVLWGGCDAAAASLIHGPSFPRVSGMILGNPFVHDETMHAKVVVRHYYWQRIRQKAFWKKLLGLRMNPFKTAASVLSTLHKSRRVEGVGSRASVDHSLPFPLRMLAGAKRFKGRILLMMSGQSLVSKEFDELVKSSPEWQRTIRRDGVTRIDFPDADQAFSTIAARDEQIALAAKWLAGLDRM